MTANAPERPSARSSRRSSSTRSQQIQDFHRSIMHVIIMLAIIISCPIGSVFRGQPTPEEVSSVARGLAARTAKWLMDNEHH